MDKHSDSLMTRIRALGVHLHPIDFMALIILLSHGLLSPVPITEGWFIELTRSKGFGEILAGSDILIPPLYPLATKIISVVSDHLLLYRLVGTFVGTGLYVTTKKCAYISSALMQGGGTRHDCGPNLIALYMLLFCYGYSLYTIWYDFTMIVLLMQVFIVYLCLLMLASINKNMCRAEDGVAGALSMMNSRSAWAAGFLTSVGILLKQSNMGLFAVAICFYILSISACKRYKDAALKFWKGTFTGGLLILLWIIWGGIYAQEGEGAMQILSSSVVAKGGGYKVFGFVDSFYKTWSSIHTESATLLLSAGIAVLVYISVTSKGQAPSKDKFIIRMVSIMGFIAAFILILWDLQHISHGKIDHWALQTVSATINSALMIGILTATYSLAMNICQVNSWHQDKLVYAGTICDENLSSFVYDSKERHARFSFWFLPLRYLTIIRIQRFSESVALPLLFLWLSAGIGSVFGNVTSAGLGFNGLYIFLTLTLVLLLLAARGVVCRFNSNVSTLVGIGTAVIMVVCIGNISVQEFGAIHGDYIFRWWDIAQVRYGDKLCSPREVYQGVWPLRVACSDVELGKSLKKEILGSPYKYKNIPIVLPAQTLLYRLRGLGDQRIRNATITWNDFMVGGKSLRTIENVANLRGDTTIRESTGKPYVLIVTKTSPETLQGSGINFGSDIGSNVYYQRMIESRLFGLNADKRFKSALFSRHNGEPSDVLLLIERPAKNKP